MTLSFDRLRQWARRMKREVVALMFACRDRDMPLAPKLLALFVVAYALSPIDLIPDFIPVLGYLDDVILVPFGIWLCLRWIPAPVLARSRRKADAWLAGGHRKPRSTAGLIVVLVIWLLAAWGVFLLWQGER